MGPASPGKSWNLKRVMQSPGILLKFWKSPGFFCGQTVQIRDFSINTSTFGLLLYVGSSSSLTNCCDIHLRYVYIYSAHHLVLIFKFTIKNLILELRNCMANPNATVNILFDSSPFETH